MDWAEVGKDIIGKSLEIIPLILVYGAVQASLAGIKAVQSMVSGASRKAQDASGKWSSDFRKRQEGRREIDALGGNGSPLGRFKYGRRARRDAITKGIETEAGRARAGYIAGLAEKDEDFRQRLAGGGVGREASPEALQRALAGAISVQAKVEADEVSAASAIIKNANLDLNDLRQLSAGGSAKGLDGSSIAVRRAAMQSLVQANDVAGINNLVDNSRLWGRDLNATPKERADGDKLRRTLAESLGNSGSRPAYLSRGVLANIENGTNTQDASQLLDAAIDNGTYSAKAIADADKDELELLANALNARPAPLTQAAADVRSNADTALKDPRLSTGVGKNRAQAERVAGLRP